MLTGVSLFAGIGGFDLAMERQGIKPVAAVEIDKKASGVLADQFPDIHLFTDIKGVTGGDLLSAGFNPERGIITGGFPCQDLSVAGRRAGLAGERSGLFWEIHRLAAETKTKWLVLENVPGLLSSNDGRDMGIVLGSLAELGYGLAYRVLDAQHFGVAQRRRRVFIVGCLGDDWRASAKVLDLGEGRRGYHQKSHAKGQSPTAEAATSAGSSGPEAVASFSTSSFAEYTENEGVSATLRAGGGDVGGGSETILVDGSVYGSTGFSKYSEGVTALTYTQHKRPEDNIVIEPYVKIVRSGERDADGNLPAEVWAERETAPTLNLMDNGGDSRATVIAVQNTVIGRADTSGPQGRGHSDEGGPMFTIDTTSPHVIVFSPHKEDGARVQGDTISTLTAMMGTGGNNVPMLTIESDTVPTLTAMGARGYDASRLAVQAYDEFNDSLADTHHTLRAGTKQSTGVLVTENGVESLTPWAEMGEAMRVYGDSGVAPTVKPHNMSVLAESVVRRLTPVECERLQGFPDDWTITSDGKPQADSSRYKQTGNAVAVPVAEWVLGRIVESE
jgi:DNA (cytosine-5)-methyltransferase 1